MIGKTEQFVDAPYVEVTYAVPLPSQPVAAAIPTTRTIEDVVSASERRNDTLTVNAAGGQPVEVVRVPAGEIWSVELENNGANDCHLAFGVNPGVVAGVSERFRLGAGERWGPKKISGGVSGYSVFAVGVAAGATSLQITALAVS